MALVYEHVTGGGLAGHDLPLSWAIEGGAMRRALARDFAAVPGVSVQMSLDARLPDEPGPWTIVRIGPGDSIPRTADCTALIAPETDGILDELTGLFANSLGGTREAIRLAADKHRLTELLGQNDVPVPQGLRVRPELGLPQKFPYPAVLKPIDGAGSFDTFLIKSYNDIMITEFSRSEGVIEPFVPGEPRSATFLKSKGGKSRARLIGVSRQTIVVEGGRFAYQGGVLINDPLPVDHPARRAVEALTDLYGLIGVDYIHHPQTCSATVIEVNPRPTTSCVALVAVLGPGRLASAWLDGYDRCHTDLDLLAMARPSTPVVFSANGELGNPFHTAGVGSHD